MKKSLREEEKARLKELQTPEHKNKLIKEIIGRIDRYYKFSEKQKNANKSTYILDMITYEKLLRESGISSGKFNINGYIREKKKSKKET
jgi:hypothetical protein